MESIVVFLIHPHKAAKTHECNRTLHAMQRIVHAPAIRLIHIADSDLLRSPQNRYNKPLHHKEKSFVHLREKPGISAQ
jgi:hypothetical protein